MTSYYTVGVMTKPHGLRGEMKVYPRTDFAEKRFRAGSKLYVRSEGGSPIAQVEVRTGRKQQNMWIVGFKDLQSIHDVERWRGMELCVEESELEPLPEGTYYIHQLVGLQVYTDEGTFVGELTEVLTPGANDVYVVRGPLKKGDVLLPAIPECIQKVDLAANRMTIHIMPGLLGDDED
ncbi:ribosome maturation factor RimM [Alicyclobacillus fastidiosus]|uniref:Ribosome maturation factor RimM n=1 Tax=Alicyclobacillus fastidiosus TaxID=392011 RepID=A0ABV5AIL6_9BACL|nr:ribosome maturation factor RimM [Alicyclobacillus fastidiosus]WEH08049.1 ribosome maturation factor RimM [Alicyclobacillus fastidiosus]